MHVTTRRCGSSAYPWSLIWLECGAEKHDGKQHRDYARAYRLSASLFKASNRLQLPQVGVETCVGSLYNIAFGSLPPAATNACPSTASSNIDNEQLLGVHLTTRYCYATAAAMFERG